MEGKYRHKLRKEAREELLSAAEWYESKKEGLGEEFYNEVENKIKQLSEKPDSHSKFFKDFRRASLEKFPYWIMYIFQAPIVLILSIWHKKKNPDTLIEKLDK